MTMPNFALNLKCYTQQLPGLKILWLFMTKIQLLENLYRNCGKNYKLLNL